jgi:hypothetical protein
LIPIFINNSEIHLAEINLHEKKFILYETNRVRTAEWKAFENPILVNLEKFLNKENNSKLMKNLNILSWDFIYGNNQ